MDALPVMQCLCSLRSMRHSRGGGLVTSHKDVPHPTTTILVVMNGRRWKEKGSEHVSVLVISVENVLIFRRKIPLPY